MKRLCRVCVCVCVCMWCSVRSACACGLATRATRPWSATSTSGGPRSSSRSAATTTRCRWTRSSSRRCTAPPTSCTGQSTVSLPRSRSVAFAIYCRKGLPTIHCVHRNVVTTNNLITGRQWSFLYIVDHRVITLCVNYIRVWSELCVHKLSTRKNAL